MSKHWSQPLDFFFDTLCVGCHLRHRVSGLCERSLQFARAIIMPNLRPPVCTTAQAVAYRERILRARPATGPHAAFEPLMTLYLTDGMRAIDCVFMCAFV
jgi:dihydroorotase